MALKLAMLRSWKAIVAIGVGLGVIAGIIGSLSTIKKGSKEFIAPLFEKEAKVDIGLGTSADRYVRVGLNFDQATGKFDAVKELNGGKEMSVELPANAKHHVEWQGFNFKPAAADIIVGAEASKWILKITGREEDLDILSLVEAGTQKEAPTVLASATALVAAANVATASMVNADTLTAPMNRAYSVVGLLEVGSAACTNSLIINRMTIVVGCVGFLPGNLTQVLSRLDARQPGLIDEIMGQRLGELRAAERAFANPNIPTDDDFRRRVSVLTQTPQFKEEFEKLNRAQYDRAVREARTLGLYSERGVLFVFDRIWNSGSVRSLRSAGEGPAAFSPGTELQRLQQLAQLAVQGTRPQWRRFLEPRIEMIAAGRGKVHGVDFDLDALGIRYDKPLGS